MLRHYRTTAHTLNDSEVEWVCFVVLLSAVSCELSAFLLLRRIRRSAHMQMAQIPQGAPILVAHPFGKPWIIQSLIPRRFRHVLQHAQSLLYRLTPVGRHLPPFRQHIILDVVFLRRSHLRPDMFPLRLVRSLLRSHAIPLIKLLPDLVLLFRRHSLERRAVLEEPLALRRWHLPHPVYPRPRRANSQLLPRRQISRGPNIRPSPSTSHRSRSLIGMIIGRWLRGNTILTRHRRTIRIRLRRILVLRLRRLLLTVLLAHLLRRWRRRMSLLRGTRQRHSPA